MGGIFSFLNTFFVGSLLMSVILVVMMLFQFRQRIKQLEEKGDTMLQIINSIVEKMKITELEVSPQYVGGNNAILNEEEDNFITSGEVAREQYEEEMEDDEASGDEDEASGDEDEESGDEDEESGDEDEESGDEQEQEPDESGYEQEQEQEEVDINNYENKEDTVVNDIPESIEVSETDVNSLVSDEGLSKDDNSSVFSKLTVSQLKEEVKNKGLASNISKLRKSELIELLATN
jgi:cobalamin biosynthesis protein CobT